MDEKEKGTPEAFPGETTGQTNNLSSETTGHHLDGQSLTCNRRRHLSLHNTLASPRPNHS